MEEQSEGLTQTVTQNSKGFTLVELLIVIAFIGVLAAIISLTSSDWPAAEKRKQQQLSCYCSISG
jgi:prepilin-type N-terminal cleavage/methylation domain-containing protein